MTQAFRYVTHCLERAQEACPGLCGFMNWAPMGGFYRLVEQELPVRPRERVLDFGCGRGAFSHLFEPRSYLGVDIAHSLVRYAQKKHPAHGYAVMDGRFLGLRDSQWDAALVVGVLHHLDDTLAAAGLQEILWVLKPGGRVLILEPIPVVKRWNLYSRLIKSMDAGHFIRPFEAWPRLVGNILPLSKAYQRRVALNDVIVMKGSRKG